MNTQWRNSFGESTQTYRVDPPNTDLRDHPLVDLDGQHHRLQDLVSQLRGWLYEVEQIGIPKFGETGYRLRHLRSSLNEHFDCCLRQRGKGIDSSVDDESKVLLERLSHLIQRLEMPDPPFESWQELIRCLKEFSDDLECLEERMVGPLK